MTEKVIRGDDGSKTGSLMPAEKFCQLTGLTLPILKKYVAEGVIKKIGDQYSYNSYLIYLGFKSKNKKGSGS